MENMEEFHVVVGHELIFDIRAVPFQVRVGFFLGGRAVLSKK